jgi:hypothetical protein
VTGKAIPRRINSLAYRADSAVIIAFLRIEIGSYRVRRQAASGVRTTFQVRLSRYVPGALEADGNA